MDGTKKTSKVTESWGALEKIFITSPSVHQIDSVRKDIEITFEFSSFSVVIFYDKDGKKAETDFINKMKYYTTDTYQIVEELKLSKVFKSLDKNFIFYHGQYSDPFYTQCKSRDFFVFFNPFKIDETLLKEFTDEI